MNERGSGIFGGTSVSVSFFVYSIDKSSAEKWKGEKWFFLFAKGWKLFFSRLL